MKKITSFLILFVFFIAIFPKLSSENAYAYQNSSYFTGVKVGLVSMASNSITLVTTGDYSVNGQAYPSGSIFVLSGNGTSYTMNGTNQSSLSFIPDNSSNLLTVTSNSITNNYMGSFRFVISKNKILPINSIDIESYLMGVVGYEMSNSYPIEALKAQTVAARNYALSRIGYESANGYDFDDTPSYQVYKGYNPTYSNVISAVNQTRGQALLYNNTLVETLYSAWHGGISEDSENVWGNYVPYLRSVQDSFENSLWPNGSIILTNAQIQSALIAKGYLAASDIFLKLDLSSITKFPSGRLSNINILYKNSSGITLTKSVTKDSTRTFLTLPSSLYSVTYDPVNGQYTFSGKGNGHGLGMSQIGAKNRASAGQTYDQILKFYYQNVTLQNLIQKATVDSLVISRSAVISGSSVIVSATAAAGNGDGYLFKYIIKNGNSVVYTNNYSNDPNLSYTPTSSGNYTVSVYVKDLFSSLDYDDTATQVFTVYDASKLSGVTLNSNQLFLNSPVHITASGTSGSGNYLFKYVITCGSINYTQDYSPNNTLDYTPIATGNYTVNTYIKDVLSSNSYDDTICSSFIAYPYPKLSDINADKSQLFANDSIHVSSSGSSGTGSYLYKFIVTSDNNTNYIKDYSPQNSIDYTPPVSGHYSVTVYLKDILSQNPYDDMKSKNFIVYTSPSIAVSSTPSSILVGNNLNMTASECYGSGSATYRFVVATASSNLFDSGFSSSNNFTYNVTTPGALTINAYLKDSISSNVFDAQNTYTLMSYNPLLTSSTITGSFFEGKTLMINTGSVGASPAGFNIRYEVYNNNLLVASNSFGSNGNFTFTPPTPGIYNIKVYGKDGLSTDPYDTSSQFNVTISSKPLILSSLPISYGTTSNDVSALQNALIKLGYPVSSATGYFGAQTKSAVTAFQSSHGLTADGVVGSATYNALNEALILSAGVKTQSY